MNSKKLLWLLTIAVLVYGCYPGEVATYEELDIVITTNNPDVTITNFSTFTMPDSVTNNIPNDEPEHADLILQELRANMESFGYTYQAVPAGATSISDITADLILIPEVIITDNHIIGGGGCWYGCWCDPFWFPWGCGYYPPYPPTIVKFTTGTLVWHLIDRNDLMDQDGEISSLWVGAVNGLVRNTDGTLISRYVDQAFDQSSSYLNKNAN